MKRQAGPLETYLPYAVGDGREHTLMHGVSAAWRSALRDPHGPGSPCSTDGDDSDGCRLPAPLLLLCRLLVSAAHQSGRERLPGTRGLTDTRRRDVCQQYVPHGEHYQTG